jgi:tRNA A37 methylthiotransferase MiaB
VDNEVIIEGSDYLRIGDFVNVKITETNAYDLAGHVVE